MTKSIMLVGVGGQGTILASKLLVTGLLEAGYDVKMSEIHGMSQRGGSVSSQVRYGEKVSSPVIEVGSTDVLIAFEKMEALRYLKYLKPDGKVVVNDFAIDSMPILNGVAEYPQGVLEKISSIVDTQVVNAAKLAEELGNIKVMNVILLGTLVKSMNLESVNWNKIIEENVKERFVEINKKAIALGISLVK